MILIFNVLSIIMEIMGVVIILAGKWANGVNDVVFFNETFFIGAGIVIAGLIINSISTFYVLDNFSDKIKAGE